MDLWEMRALPGGVVILHDARRKEHRTVELEPFELGVFPVTEGQFAEVLGIAAQHPRRPARDLSWFRAIRFCNAASEWEGLDPAYSFDGEDVTWHVESEGYRLPTEAEWEYACRAGSVAPQYGPLDEIAWTSLDGVGSPQDVGMKLPNLNGLFDTLGNVWEWCWDLLDPERYDDYRVFRGGGFADDTWSVRASVRRGGGPRMHHDDVGMRLARGGFDGVDAAQGWSVLADIERGGRGGARPIGWTPRR
ncbi:SUMF1/EgtB/PvdO family nonheme iron enzyme [Microbacterium esteraromaticum]|uniref:SUMF1/EgtB/PvdO family nonheme iron enzyme n=1 Tax=Microbacterium esteraromaticum TaxID=57043 RepID=A0A7D8AMH3_9MICO|nr:SUMF1/EgtB/PvdO family nonheme iron enzyme [Microbacterium esteraromaticum]QMU98147.1 SUMF1/EgtB/PvdO family nonheme iron enzyme [Microbacterium esteraromaticum]